MKNYLYLLSISALLLVISAFSSETSEVSSIESMTYDIPENINAIFDNSCIMCHNKDAKNEKSKKKLMLDEMSSLSKSKFISKLSKINKAVSSGDMPPEKFASKYPDKKLSQEDKAALISWSKDYAEELSKK